MSLKLKNIQLLRIKQVNKFALAKNLSSAFAAMRGPGSVFKEGLLISVNSCKLAVGFFYR